MRVLKDVAHILDLQYVVKFSFVKRTVLTLRLFAFRPTLNNVLQPSRCD